MEKRNGIRKAILISIIMSVIVLCQACLKYDDVTICGATLATYAIPGAGGYTPHNKPLIKLLERDDYGRVLYSIQTKDDYQINALFITQKSDQEYVYYYDNICYICLVVNEITKDQAIENLKHENDWGTILNESKMTRRVLNSKTDLFPQMEFNYSNECKLAFEQNVIIPEGCNTWFQASDVSSTGQELYLGSVFKINKLSESSDMVWQGHYLMVINADGTYDPDNFIVKFDDLYNSNEPLIRVKEQNDWQN